ncbi:MAG: hypothetical protein ACFE95_17030 [Candidatus Hodarchaeota archaeon]
MKSKRIKLTSSEAFIKAFNRFTLLQENEDNEIPATTKLKPHSNLHEGM